MLSFLLGKYLGGELLNYMVGVWLSFRKLLDCFLKWLFHNTLPSAVYEAANCSAFLLKLLMVNLFTFSHSSVCTIVSYCGSNLHFSNELWCLVFFSYVSLPSTYLLYWNTCWNPLPIFKLEFFPCYYWVGRVLYKFYLWVLWWRCFENIFSQPWLAFLFSQQWFLRHRSFYF